MSHAEVEPLLVAKCVGVDAHVQIIGALSHLEDLI